MAAAVAASCGTVTRTRAGVRAWAAPPMLITFSGLDGSGKSTLIAWLKSELERRHVAVTVLHVGNDVGVYACLRYLRDAVKRIARRHPEAAGGKVPPRPHRRTRRVRNAVVWNKPLRRALYPVDLVMFLAVRFFVEHVQRRILVTDRYFYDTLVDVADQGRWFWVRLLERLTPAPDVAVFLDVSPEESFERKREYSVPYLALRSASYRMVAPLVPSALVLPNRDLVATRRALQRAVWERLSA